MGLILRFCFQLWQSSLHWCTETWWWWWCVFFSGLISVTLSSLVFVPPQERNVTGYQTNYLSWETSSRVHYFMGLQMQFSESCGHEWCSSLISDRVPMFVCLQKDFARDRGEQSICFTFEGVNLLLVLQCSLLWFL